MNLKINLDSISFKALAAGSRVSILKHLKSRRYTQSELAELLDLKVPSVKEHLQALEKAELVRKIDEGRKWKYYELTPKAKAILDPERKQILITLVMFLLSAVGAVYLFFKDLSSQTGIYKLNSVAKESAASIDGLRLTNETRYLSEPNYWIYVFTIIALVSLIILVYFLVKRRKISSILRLLP